MYQYEILNTLYFPYIYIFILYSLKFNLLFKLHVIDNPNF